MRTAAFGLSRRSKQRVWPCVRVLPGMYHPPPATTGIRKGQQEVKRKEGKRNECTQKRAARNSSSRNGGGARRPGDRQHVRGCGASARPPARAARGHGNGDRPGGVS